jgi:hypothetical protein
MYIRGKYSLLPSVPHPQKKKKASLHSFLTKEELAPC